MPKTYQDVLTEARVILQDSDSSKYRVSDIDLVAKLNRSLQELYRMRPDAFYNSYDFETDASEPTVGEITVARLSREFAPDMMFYTAIVYFVVGSAELLEDEYTTDGRAATLLAGFRQAVIGA